jgi:hypothetical protein
LKVCSSVFANNESEEQAVLEEEERVLQMEEGQSVVGELNPKALQEQER